MRLLLVFLKEPIAGKVKTRLAADLGDDEEAARYYKALVEVLLRQLQGLNDCRIRFCYTPDDAGDAIRFWILPAMNATAGKTEGVYLAASGAGFAQEVDFCFQGDGDLSERMQRAIVQGIDEGFDEIMLIASDCPDCGARWINAAFARLNSDDTPRIVIGLGSHGGCYLLGMNSPALGIFSGIPWSGGEMLERTLSAARDAGVSVVQLPELSAVNHLTDWKRILKSPLGPIIKKALGEEPDDDWSDVLPNVMNPASRDRRESSFDGDEI